MSQMIAVEQLKPNPWNRTVFDPAALQELTDSLKSGGIKEPLIVRAINGGSTYEIASGHRRWLAAQKAGIKEVPCDVQTLTDEEVQDLNLIANIQREDLPLLEMSRMVQGYMDQFHQGQQEAALKFGKTQTWVSKLVGFLDIEAGARENMNAFIFSWSQLDTIKQSSNEIQQQVGKELKEGKLKPEQVQKRCAELGGGKKKGPKKQKDAVQQHMAEKGISFKENGSQVIITAPYDRLNTFEEFTAKLKALLMIWGQKHPYTPTPEEAKAQAQQQKEQDDYAKILSERQAHLASAAPVPPAVPPATVIDPTPPKKPMDPKLAAMIARQIAKGPIR